MFRRFLRRLFGRFSSFLRLHPDVEPLIAGGFRLTNPLSAAYPSENLPFASRVIASGMWNYCFFQFYRHFAGPYWVERQYNPADPLFHPKSKQHAFAKLTHRTWMGLRSPGETGSPWWNPPAHSVQWQEVAASNLQCAKDQNFSLQPEETSK